MTEKGSQWLVICTDLKWSPIKVRMEFLYPKNACHAIPLFSNCAYFWRDKQGKNRVQQCAGQFVLLSDHFKCDEAAHMYICLIN